MLRGKLPTSIISFLPKLIKHEYKSGTISGRPQKMQNT